MMLRYKSLLILLTIVVTGCGNFSDQSMTIDDRLNQYTPFTLTSDVSDLTENQKKMILLLIDAADEMEKVFWKQAYGMKDELMDGLSEKEQRFAEINYGPWD